MTETDAIQILYRYHEGLFPKVCHNCGRRYATLREYVVATERLWPASSYDAELDQFDAEQPLGGMAMANCICGSTLALSTRGMPPAQMRALLDWARTEMKVRGLDQKQLSDHLRDEVRRLVLRPGIEP
jgi:hypothetical protein